MSPPAFLDVNEDQLLVSIDLEEISILGDVDQDGRITDVVEELDGGSRAGLERILRAEPRFSGLKARRTRSATTNTDGGKP